MTQIIEHVLSMLAQEPAQKLKMIARSRAMPGFLKAQYLPENWQEEPPQQTTDLDSTATGTDAAYRAEIFDQAEKKWEELPPETREAVMSAVKTLDPEADLERLELLGQFAS